MNTLRAAVSVTSLEKLTSVGQDTYRLFAHLLDGSGQPVTDSKYPASPFQVDIQTTQNNFNVDIPVEDSVNSIDLTLKLTSGADPECCNDSIVVNLVNEPEWAPTGEQIDICASSKSAGGIGGTLTYYWTNDTGAAKPVYWEWFTDNFPDRLQVLINDQIWYDTFCAGPMPNTCNPPGSCGYIPESTYGHIDVPIGKTITFSVDGDCAAMGGTVWNFKTSCNPFATSPVTYDGSAPACAVQIIDFDTAAAGTIYLNKWSGALSGQYEFAFQPEATADASTATWVQDNSEDPGAGMYFGGLTTGTQYRIWIRDKANPGCISFINAIPS